MSGTPGVRVHAVEVGPLMVNAYVVEHVPTRKALVIDPGDDAPLLLGALRDRGLAVEAILLTHGHFDHVGGVGEVKAKTGARVYLHPGDLERMRTARRQGLLFGLSVPDPPAPDVLVEEGDTIPFADLSLSVLHTPGHTPGCVTYRMGDQAFVGDLIFAGSIGRTDLPGGDHEQLLESVRTKIFVLPDETVLHPGHGPATTVGREKRTNPFFAGGWDPWA